MSKLTPEGDALAKSDVIFWSKDFQVDIKDLIGFYLILWQNVETATLF